MFRPYSLPQLPYALDALAPQISEAQLTLHYQKHHQAYVNAANALLEKLDKARQEKAAPEMKALAKDLSFQVGGHLLHSLFWENLAPAASLSLPAGRLLAALNDNFGSEERFRSEFTQAALSVEGSGWAALVFDALSGRCLIAQIEKHNVNAFPALPILLVADVFEHAYYLDYKNERVKYLESFWQIVNWPEVARRFERAAVGV